MSKRVNIYTAGSDYLFILSGIFCASYIFMRGLAAGSYDFNPEDYFLGLFSFAGFLFAILSRMLCNGIIIPPKKILLALAFYFFTVLSSYFTASMFNYKYPALNSLNLCLTDILLFLAITITARDRNVFRFYYALLCSVIVTAGCYALYQRIYVINYLQDIFTNSAVFRQKIFAQGMVAAQMFIERLQTNWVDGGLREPGSLAALSLLIMFFFLNTGKNHKNRLTDIILFACLLSIVLAESWYGILSAKIIEIFLLNSEAEQHKSRFKRIMSITGEVGIFTIITVIISLIFLIATDYFVAQLIFTLIWLFEFLFLRSHLQSGIKKYEYLEGFAFIILMILLSIIVGLSSDTSDLGNFADFCKYSLKNEMSEILTAWNAFSVSPVFGWGLGNYSEVFLYFQQKPFTDSARSISSFLTLLAEGGVILWGGFITFTGVILLSGKPEKRELQETEYKYRHYPASGIIIIISSFIILYLLVFSGLFSRMGTDCLILEITGSPESALARTGNYFPLIVHFCFNLILLPALSVYIFILSLKADIDFTNIFLYIKLSLAAFLLFSLSGSFLSHSALNGYFWIMLGMLISREQIWGVLNIKFRIRNFITYITIILILLWGVWGIWSGFVRISVEQSALKLAGKYQNAASLKSAQELTEQAIILSPANADLYMQQADFILQINKLTNNTELSQHDYIKAEKAINRAITLRPYAAAYYLHKADFLSNCNPAEKDLIRKNYLKALQLHPFNARYLYLFALYLNRTADHESARQYALQAIRLNLQYFNNFSAGLNRFEITKAREIAYSKTGQ